MALDYHPTVLLEIELEPISLIPAVLMRKRGIGGGSERGVDTYRKEVGTMAASGG